MMYSSKKSFVEPLKFITDKILWRIDKSYGTQGTLEDFFDKYFRYTLDDMKQSSESKVVQLYFILLWRWWFKLWI